MSHTPGPWTAGPADWMISQKHGVGWRNFPVRAPGGFDVAAVYCDEDDAEQAANVSLIESAPALLALVKRLHEVFEQLDGDWRELDATYVDELISSDGLRACEQAIAKAEGRTR